MLAFGLKHILSYSRSNHPKKKKRTVPSEGFLPGLYRALFFLISKLESQPLLLAFRQSQASHLRQASREHSSALFAPILPGETAGPPAHRYRCSHPWDESRPPLLDHFSPPPSFKLKQNIQMFSVTSIDSIGAIRNLLFKT